MDGTGGQGVLHRCRNGVIWWRWPSTTSIAILTKSLPALQPGLLNPSVRTRSPVADRFWALNGIALFMVFLFFTSIICYMRWRKLI